MIPANNITWCIECHHCYYYVNNKMEKAKELSVDLRQGIINLYKLGNSYSTISNWLPIPSTVQSLKKKLKQFGMTENLPGCGRKAKLSTRTAQKLCHKVNINPRVVLKDNAKSLDTIGVSISICTICCLNRNQLHENQPR